MESGVAAGICRMPGKRPCLRGLRLVEILRLAGDIRNLDGARYLHTATQAGPCRTTHGTRLHFAISASPGRPRGCAEQRRDYPRLHASAELASCANSLASWLHEQPSSRLLAQNMCFESQPALLSMATVKSTSLQQ